MARLLYYWYVYSDQTNCYTYVDYTINYNAQTNTSTVTLSSGTYVGGDSGWSHSSWNTITVAATDSGDSASFSYSNNNTTPVDYYSGQKVYTLKHSPTAGTKQIKISGSSGGWPVHMWGSQHGPDGSGSQTATSGTYTTYTLNISAETGATCEISRVSSPNGASAEVLTDGSVIHYGDVLSISSGAITGYESIGYTINGNAGSGGNYTVTGNTEVISKAQVKEFSLGITEPFGINLVINRLSSPLKGADIGKLTSETKIYYNDELQIVYTPKPNYMIESVILNNNSIQTGHTFIVTSNVDIIANVISTISPFKMYIYNGVNWNGPYSISL